MTASLFVGIACDPGSSDDLGGSGTGGSGGTSATVSTGSGAGGGGSAGASGVAGGGTPAQGQAGAGAMTGDGGAAGAEGASCSVAVDPADGCPASLPAAASACEAGTVCEYVQPSNGCDEDWSRTLAYCGDESAWVVAETACTTPSEDVPAGTWTGTQRLWLAETRGDCGAFGGLAVNVDEATFGEWACAPGAAKSTDCHVEQEFVDCNHPSEPSSNMTVELSLDWTGNHWAGVATLALTSDPLTCSGSYTVRAEP